ncbi:eukaryotic translation initiation factor 4 gamma-like [Lathyrus oleraceus]|uniref:eukaryotic translation initiation factor 4 gamma-like n=1 Tax=Pisum sativum TaxID=3888 RepID=UPI0021D376EA|nr:eukaryotic translation initiation factor 4 gamma-like [Pisum sativum]
MTYEAFKLKGLSEQVRNDFVRDVAVRLQAHLVREAEEKAIREVEEKARLEEEQWIREVVEKVVAEAAAAAATAAEAKAKAKAESEEAAHIAVEEAAKDNTDTLTQGEQSNFGFTPLFLKTLEELQKEQQIVRVRLDHKDSINNNIQNLLTQLIPRMPHPPNP